MKAIIILILIGLSFFCFAQENDRAVIVKNKVKSVRKFIDGTNIEFITEYKSKGLITKVIENGNIGLNNAVNVTYYKYKDTLLVLEVQNIIKGDSLIHTDSIFYKYDKLGRLENVYHPSNPDQAVSLERYIYINSFSAKIKKILFYLKPSQLNCKDCIYKYKNREIFYLSYYKLYKYENTSNPNPVIYDFNHYFPDHNSTNCKYLNSEIEFKEIINDTLIKYIKKVTIDSLNNRKNIPLCDSNEITEYRGNDVSVVIEKIKDSKVSERIIKDDGSMPRNGTEFYYYNQNGLINNFISKITFYQSCRRDIIVGKSDETWNYTYEYYK